MAENTKIEWADHTFNPWIGCTKISPACDHCYAEGWAKRYGRAAWGPGNPRQRTSEHNWRLPLKWNAEADRDIPKLLAVPAAKRFLSIEPMLGAIDITAACAKHRWTDPDGVERVSLPRELDWIILGGETGPGSRPMHPDWVRSLRDQCQVARALVEANYQAAEMRRAA